MCFFRTDSLLLYTHLENLYTGSTADIVTDTIVKFLTSPNIGEYVGSNEQWPLVDHLFIFKFTALGGLSFLLLIILMLIDFALNLMPT